MHTHKFCWCLWNSSIKQGDLIVSDVLKYPNYISCDSKTASEIVVPIFQKKKLVAVLDIDSKR